MISSPYRRDTTSPFSCFHVHSASGGVTSSAVLEAWHAFVQLYVNLDRLNQGYLTGADCNPVLVNVPPCFPVPFGPINACFCLDQKANNSVTMWIALDDCDREVGERRLGSEWIDRALFFRAFGRTIILCPRGIKAQWVIAGASLIVV